MDYILKRKDNYYYNRRVPAPLRPFVQKEFVRIALKTDSRKTALKRAVKQNDEIERYWNTLLQSGDKHSHDHYRAVIERSRLIGFPYYTSNEVASLPLQQIIDRLLHAEKEKLDNNQVEAVLGGVSAPVIMLSDVLSRFWAYAKDKTLNKSPDQIRKWRNPRIKAFRNFLSCIPNKPIHELTREDMLCFREWWMDRIQNGEVIAASANKDLIYVKMIITTVADNAKIKLERDHIFRKLILDDTGSEKRLSFDPEFLTSTLLNHDNLKGMGNQAKWVLFAFAETGAGLSELTGVLPEDIHLDHPIPHICITPRHQKALKTKYRKRIIPLVGYALDAFKECPEGFTHYRDRPDSLSASIGKYLKANGLLPSDKHTIYSLRHNFQDRLLAVKAPDRLQADLMGHKFHRPEYGHGSTLKQKLEFMQKIQLKK